MKISIRYGRTFNLGNYQTERIDLELEQDLNLEQFLRWQEISDELFDQVQAKVLAFYRRMEDKAKQIAKEELKE